MVWLDFDYIPSWKSIFLSAFLTLFAGILIKIIIRPTIPEILAFGIGSSYVVIFLIIDKLKFKNGLNPIAEIPIFSFIFIAYFKLFASIFKAIILTMGILITYIVVGYALLKIDRR